MSKLILNMKIYKEEAILEAIYEFEKIAPVDYEIDEINQRAVINFHCSEKMRQKFHDEFCNYLISIIVALV